MRHSGVCSLLCDGADEPRLPEHQLAARHPCSTSFANTVRSLVRLERLLDLCF